MAVITYPHRRQTTAAAGRLGTGRLLAFLLVSAAVLGLLSLTLSALITTRGYEVQGLQAERGRWAERIVRVETEISALQSFDRVEREARARLKLTEARDRLFVSPAALLPPIPEPAPAREPADPDLLQLVLDRLAWLRRLLADAAAGPP